MTYELNDLLDEYGQESKILLEMTGLQLVQQIGNTIGVPTMKPVALTPMVIIRQDIADELGIDMSQINPWKI